MNNLFEIKPARKPFTLHLRGKAKNILHIEKGINSITEYFNFDLNDTVQLHECKQVFDMVLICCQQSGKRHDDPKQFEEAFDLFRRSHTAN